MYDIAIIGTGVIGALTARALSAYNLKICMLEKCTDVSMGASAANSGIVHAGYDAPTGSLKAKFNVAGNKLMKNTATQLGVKYAFSGSYVVGYDEEDLKVLKALLKRGEKNGVSGLKIVERHELRSIEPNISDNALCALYAKSAGIVSPYELAIAAAGNAMDNGAHLKLKYEVSAILCENDGYTIISSSGEKTKCRVIINCAGVYSDKIARMVGDNSFKINARKGEYILLDREYKGFVNSTLFPCPSERGKGVLVTPTVSGNILIGPTSVEGEDKEDNSLSADGFDYIIKHAALLCKNIPLYGTIASFCGVRAYSDRHDFIIETSKKSEGFINVAGIESPGLTASPAIAEYVCSLALDKFKNVKKNPSFNPIRKPDNFFRKLSLKEKNELIKNDPSFGKIICRCEETTLGEILFSISRNPVPSTIDAIKRRTRSGMGRCQGGFCQPYIAELLNKQLKIPYTEILKSDVDSQIFTGKTKG